MQPLKTEIKEFLTSRRARLTPHQVGLVLDGSARRVPGLRREEVAQLADISVEYYVLLERGNLLTASDPVLAGLARALRLDEDETTYLHNLARASRNTEALPPPSPPESRVTSHIHSLLDGFATGPAWIRNEYMDILATNSLARALYDPIYQSLPDRPNTARHVFLAANARSFWVDAGYYTEAFVAKLRMERATRPADPHLESLVTELTGKSETFRHHWSSAEVSLFRNGIKRFNHPKAGRLDLHFETMELKSAPGLVMSIYLPTGPTSRDRLSALHQWAAAAGF